MYCPNCGKKISTDAKYCGFCGYKVRYQKVQRLWLNTVADYLKLVGMKVTISLKSSDKIVTGIVEDLSDDGKSLILINLQEGFKNRRKKHNVSLSEIDVVEVVDRFLKQ